MEDLLGGRREPAQRAPHGGRSAEVAKVGGESSSDRRHEALLEDEEAGERAPGAGLGGWGCAEQQRRMTLDRSRRGDRCITAARQPADAIQVEVLILERMHDLPEGGGALSLAGLDVRDSDDRVVHPGAGIERQ